MRFVGIAAPEIDDRLALQSDADRRADLLKVVLLMRGNRNIVVINIPWYLDKEPKSE